jgi:hypothetical protein
MTMEMRSLPVTLTDEELKIRADQLASKVKEVNQLEAEKKVNASAFKEKIERVAGERDGLSTTVKERREDRPVECYWMENWKLYTMELVRSDTQERVDSRPMTHNERQGSLKFSNVEPKHDPATGEVLTD